MDEHFQKSVFSEKSKLELSAGMSGTAQTDPQEKYLYHSEPKRSFFDVHEIFGLEAIYHPAEELKF